jgi:amidase
LARTVRDAALFLDVVADRPSGVGYVEAASSAPPKLKIAVTTKWITGVIAKLDPEIRAATERTAELLRSLGHEVVQQDVPFKLTTYDSIVVRYLAGIAADVATGGPDRSAYQRHTRVNARLGKALTRFVPWSKRSEAKYAEPVERFFAGVDVVLSPALTRSPLRIGQYDRIPAALTTDRAAAFAAYLPVWNLLGMPAASIPAGFHSDGMPINVQLAGPKLSEPRLLALSAQLEAANPWADKRPPVS